MNSRLYAMMSQYPEVFAEKVLEVNLWSKQKEVLNSVFENDITVVSSCHSAGKTFVGAVIALTFLFTRIPSKVITTAPTYYQVKDLLWSEINKLALRLKEKGFEFDLMNTKLRIRSDWFAEGISPKNPVNFHGYHQKHILVIFDESSGVRSEIVNGAMGLMASGDAHMLHIANPLAKEGHFWELYSSVSTVYRKKSVKIAYYDTPNFTGEECPIEVKRNLINQRYVEYMKEVYGESSPIFLSKCLGEFSDVEISQVVSYNVISQALDRYNEVKAEGDVVIGLDVARFGDDLTVFCVRQGEKVLKFIPVSKRDVAEVAGIAKRIYSEYGASAIVVDVVGVGAGVYDLLVEEGYNAIPFNGAEGAEGLYQNKRAEMYFFAERWLRSGAIPSEPLLIGDLMNMRYKYMSNGRIQIESKEELKKRIGRSPDYADAFVMSLVTDNSPTFFFELERSELNIV